MKLESQRLHWLEASGQASRGRLYLKWKQKDKERGRSQGGEQRHQKQRDRFFCGNTDQSSLVGKLPTNFLAGWNSTRRVQCQIRFWAHLISPRSIFPSKRMSKVHKNKWRRVVLFIPPKGSPEWEGSMRQRKRAWIPSGTGRRQTETQRRREWKLEHVDNTKRVLNWYKGRRGGGTALEGKSETSDTGPRPWWDPLPSRSGPSAGF